MLHKPPYCFVRAASHSPSNDSTTDFSEEDEPENRFETKLFFLSVKKSIPLRSSKEKKSNRKILRIAVTIDW